jgi:hypothetical protein
MPRAGFNNLKDGMATDPIILFVLGVDELGQKNRTELLFQFG